MPVRTLLATAALVAALAPALPAAAAPAPGCPALSGSAGADLIRVSTGLRVASSEVMTPPEDCMIVSGASTLAPSRPRRMSVT